MAEIEPSYVYKDFFGFRIAIGGEYHANDRYNPFEVFGLGINTDPDSPKNSPESKFEKGRRLAWSNGCPVALELLGPNSPYGIDYMLQRYAETNLGFRVSVNRAKSLKNWAVYDLLTTSRVRLLDEPVGKHEPFSVPRSHLWEISPMSAIEGYATPRILIEVSGEYDDRNRLLDQAIRTTGEEPWFFLANLAELAVSMGAQPEKVLHHAYAKGVLEEENCFTAYRNVASAFARKAPTVFRTLESLTPNQREELAVAELPKL